MSTIDKIQELLKEKGLSQKALTDYLEIDKSTFTQWKKGKSHSYQKYIAKIADFLNTSPTELMDWKPEEHKPMTVRLLTSVSNYEAVSKAVENATIKLITDNTYYIPVYESVSAGFGAYADDRIIDYTPLFIESPEEAKNTMVIEVKGNSMYPKIEDGDCIQVLKQDWADNGQVAVVMIDTATESAVVKQYFADPVNETVKLVSFNPEYAPKIFHGAEIEQLRVLGVVKKVIKEL